MLNFQLIEKEHKIATPLSVVDYLICKDVLNVPVDDKLYGGGTCKGAFNWFDTIGFMLETGKTLTDGENSVRNHYRQSDIWQDELPTIEKIIDFLQSKYEVKRWTS